MLIRLDENFGEHLSVSTVQGLAEKYCNIPGGSTKGKTRKKEVVFARWLIFSYLKRMTDMSLAQIGRLYGDKDHATVIHGLKCLRMEMFYGWRLEAKNKFENKINEIHKRIGLKEIY
jgi:chromosomal replication initiator protein